MGGAKWLLIFFLLALHSCNYINDPILKGRRKNGNRYVLKSDRISIPLDSNSIKIYNYFSYSILNDTVYYIGYNDLKNSLDLFNLTRKKFIRHIDLSNCPSITDKKVQAIDFVNSDSIFVLSDGLLSLINDKAVEKKHYKVNDLSNPTFNNEFGYLLASLNFDLKYQKKTKSIYFFNVYSSQLNPKNRIVTSYDLDSGKFTQLPIEYSQYYKENNGDVGFLSYLNFTGGSLIGDSMIVYNFLYESNIYTYNFRSRAVTGYGAMSKYSSNNSTTISNDEPDKNLWVNHAVENTHFFEVLHDPYRNLYYRFHWGGVKLQNGKFFNSMVDKPFYLMLFDEEFNILGETRLKDRYYTPYSFFVGPEGIYLTPDHPQRASSDPKRLEFDIIQFK